jgi:hypothetical protein
MSGLVLPLPEMPDPRVAEVIELLDQARTQLRAAQERRLRVDNMVDRGVRLGHRDSMTLRVLLDVRAFEVDRWADEVNQLVEQARALGLQP